MKKKPDGRKCRGKKVTLKTLTVIVSTTQQLTMH